MANTAHSSKTKYKGTRRRLRLLMVAVICFMGWAGGTLWDQLNKMDVKMSELTILEQKLSEAEQLNAQYKHEITRLNDPEYIEQRLRKDFHMTKEGETLFIPTR